MPIPDSFLQTLRDRADIETLVSSYVNLRRSGRILMGLCPFHGEKTPSFAVYPDSNSFYCFGCGAGGDAISFLMRIDHLDYVEAVKSLCERVGMQLPEDNYDDSLAKRRMRILSANREAARFFHAQLRTPEGREGLDYWLGRRLSPETIKHFGLGYAPPRWSALLDHLRGQGFALDELVEANLVSRSERDGRTSHYDRFRHRVMVPIIDLRGNVVAFGGRVLDDSKPKYINTSDTLVYKKGRDVFALNFAKNEGGGQLILAEGYMDVIALHQAGFLNAVACLGTALTKDQAQLLARYAKEVVLSYDADEAGQAATRKALAILEQTSLKLRVLSLSGGKDPDEILRAYGPERFRILLDGAANDLEFRLLGARGDLDLTTPAGKLDYLKEAARILANQGGKMEQDIYAARLGEELGVAKQAILAQIQYYGKQAARQRERDREQQLLRTAASPPSPDPQRILHRRAAKAEERLLSLLLGHPDFFPRIREKLTAADFVTPLNRRLAEVLFGRLAAGRGVEPELLSGELDEKELSEVMRLRNLSGPGGSLLAECEDCVRALLEENRGREVASVGILDDAEVFRRQFAHKKKALGNVPQPEDSKG
ncbi:MAG: DNA primase [Oscillospiraceae bacterium]|jgi:DNA primase|nr:DNA primase [Oscillospiraceae bacterium]